MLTADRLPTICTRSHLVNELSVTRVWVLLVILLSLQISIMILNYIHFRFVYILFLHEAILDGSLSLLPRLKSSQYNTHINIFTHFIRLCTPQHVPQSLP